MEAIACAKVNLSLRVGKLRGDGRHEVAGIFQSIGWTDHLTLEFGEPDGIVGAGAAEVPAGDDNLAWQAVTAVRLAKDTGRPARLVLDKRIPVAGGLGGGSADAAAALALAGRIYDVPDATLVELAGPLGSDVPFCFRGGIAMVSGGGEGVAPLDALGGFGLAIVVPPAELSTAAVYRTWDELDGPEGEALAGSDLPPQLRDLGPLGNDLYPAAVALAPVVGEWRAELAARFGRPVFLSGSGPSLAAYFLDDEEATAALDIVPPGARMAWAGGPVTFGWAVREETGAPATDSRNIVWKDEQAARWAHLEWAR